MDDVVVLKRELAETLELLPGTKVIFQKLCPERLMIANGTEEVDR